MNKLLLILSFLASSIICDDFPIENNVTVLTDDTFDKALSQYDDVLVLFYAPWCGHCKRFKPDFEKAASALQVKNLLLAKVDCTTNKKLATKYSIHGYPTVKFFKKGEDYKYTGTRKSEDVINWVSRRRGSFLRLLKTEEEVEEIKNYNQVVVIYFGSKKEDLKVLTQVAMEHNIFPYGNVQDEELIKKYTKPGTAVLFKKYDEMRNDLTNITEKGMVEFINLYHLPKVMEIDELSNQRVFMRKLPAIVIFADKEKNKEKWEQYNSLMRQNHDSLVQQGLQPFVTEIKEGIAEKLGRYFVLNEKDLPSVRIIDSRGDDLKKYVMDGEINEKNIIEFADKWAHSKLKPFYKSEEEPKENNGDVFVVVGKTFEKEVINNDKDVLLLFYSSWSGPCIRLKPIYEEVAKKLKEKNPKIMLAKIDATDNEVPNVQVSGFPTLKFYPGNKKKDVPIDYDGERTAEDIIQFLKKHCYNKIVLDENKKETDL